MKEVPSLSPFLYYCWYIAELLGGEKLVSCPVVLPAFVIYCKWWRSFLWMTQLKWFNLRRPSQHTWKNTRESHGRGLQQHWILALRASSIWADLSRGRGLHSQNNQRYLSHWRKDQLSYLPQSLSLMKRKTILLRRVIQGRAHYWHRELSTAVEVQTQGHIARWPALHTSTWQHLYQRLFCYCLGMLFRPSKLPWHRTV